MIKAFNYEEGCVIIGSIRIPMEVATMLSGLGCAFTGWTALGILLGSDLLLPYHPRYLEVACPDLNNAIKTARRHGLMVWVGRHFITIGWIYKPLRVPLGELRIFQERPKSVGIKCGLGVASIDASIGHIVAFKEHVKDLKREYFRKILGGNNLCLCSN